MELTQIKKDLYRSKRNARFNHIRKGLVYYSCEYPEVGNYVLLNFFVPVDDMGEATFLPEMPAHELLRWLVA